MVRVLFIDDDPHAHATLRQLLSRDYTVLSHMGGSVAVEAVRCQAPDIVLLDIDIPDVDGLAVLRGIQELPDPPPVVMLTALREPNYVVASMRAGAFDFIPKPCHFDKLHKTLAQALECRVCRAPKPDEAEAGVLASIVGTSDAICGVRRLALQWSRADAPVLLQGETGTGKDLVATVIHELSSRAGGPYVPVNCASVPETLFDTEMFGSEPGAFTGAVTRAGCFEQASGGSLFLDEISETTLYAQAKLLRVIEERAGFRMGGKRKLPFDCRIIAASNRDLKERVSSGAFRHDLFYRLSVLPCRIPPLRERSEDIPVLADYFLRQFSDGRKRFMPDALKRLLDHDWPGNVRELRNTIERATVLSGGGNVSARHIRFA
jgi:DNA-binding NtrC family response regulator